MHEISVPDDCYSKGCRLCQQGKWLCIFLTYLCNAHCRFCPAPLRNQDRTVSTFGDCPEQILDRIGNTPITGISFSGGDCFLVFDRLMEWFSFFRKHRRKTYYWCYTNGLASSREKLKRVADAGMDEIRYNIAATDYNRNAILEQIEFAAGIFPRVAVEIPSIPEDYRKVTGVLPRLDQAGVAYLNLHEFIVPSRTPHSRKFRLKNGPEVHYDDRSSYNTGRIKQFCREKGLKLLINDCSLTKKQNQMIQRSKMLGGSS